MSLLSILVIISSLISSTVSSTCSYTKAISGDGCWSLAQRCGISETELKSYNSASDFCNSIIVGQYVCCSSGTLPDFAPKPYSNGTCYTYTIEADDDCSDIATAHHMNETKIPDYNKETWGWAGCLRLQKGQRICLSEGTPPFPAPMENALCGPQVPGTTQPSGMAASNWTNLNPCPLNACCDIWGQCGISDEFCTNDPADTGAPGTAKNGTNGCISNCGTNITNNEDQPSSIKRIGYFESWNLDRPCLNMDISKFQGNDYYTHVHWAFANITTSWEVDVSGDQDQFNGLLNLTGMNRILSFGGWGFSTTSYTYSILRDGVMDGNRQTLAKNIANFIVDHDLDGVDFDWEYPGAQDIPGIPADSPESPERYLEFLKLLRSELPSSKSLSIAAPASYWYLKNFPIKDMAAVVDYIVYMTYDLHGQWDYQRTYADSGCPDGGCLRSQVNKTETAYALSMITKAGVPAKQVVAGLALYGRSFKMENSSCSGPECHFTGPESGAEPGSCTQTAGYLSNYEIYQIIGQADNPEVYGNISITQYQDEGDVLIYDEDNWVSWLSPSSYASRRSWTDGLNFAGTSDWAVDLNQTYASNGTGEAVSNDVEDNYQICDYSKTYSSLDALSTASGGLRSDCIAFYALQVLINMLDVAYANYTAVNNGYNELFSYYVTYMEDMVPKVLIDDFMFNKSTTTEWMTFPSLGYGMDYFTCKLGNGDEIPCTEINGTNVREEIEEKATTLILSDQKAYDTALTNAGIDEDWVEYSTYTYTLDFVQPHASRRFEYKFADFPTKNASMVVPNPKDIVTEGIGSIPALRTAMQATLLDIMLGQWTNGSVSDAAQAYSVPVFLLMQAIDDMETAKKLGAEEKKEEEEEEKRKKDFILLIVSVVLMFVPVIGEEAAAAAGLADLARGIAIAGEAGNGALALYDTVEDPSSAVVNIIGMLFGVGSIAKVARDGKGLASVAKLRREMSANEVASLGSIFKENDVVLQTIMKICRE